MHKPSSSHVSHSPWLMALMLLSSFACSAIADPSTSVPGFANFAGVRVGLDSMERLEKQLGRGKAVTGGHPHGAREWRAVRGRAVIYADGFNSFDRDGFSYGGRRQIDAIRVSRLHGHSDLPRAHVNERRLTFMRRVGLGSSRREVLKALSSLLPAPEVEGNDLIWKAKGFVRVSAVNRYITTDWEARLHFEKGTLDEIEVSAN